MFTKDQHDLLEKHRGEHSADQSRHPLVGRNGRTKRKGKSHKGQRATNGNRRRKKKRSKHSTSEVLSRHKRAATTVLSRRWPANQVPYELEAGSTFSKYAGSNHYQGRGEVGRWGTNTVD